MAERLQRGFVTDYPDRMPPKSAKGFEWPGRNASEAQRLAFQKNLTEFIRASGENHREFARAYFGEGRDAAGRPTPRNPGTVLDWVRGEKWPVEQTARQLAAYMKRPLDSLLQDNGKPFEPLPMLRQPKGAAKRRKANGHGGNGAAAHVVSPASSPELAAALHAPLPPRPEGAAPAHLRVDAIPHAPDYCTVSITGVVRYDTAMAIVNIVGRDQLGAGRRGHK